MIRDLFRHTLGAPGWLKAWAIWVIAFPFYFFPAGSIQPSDFFIIIFAGAYIILNGFKFFKDGKTVFKGFLRFCLYLTIINLSVPLFNFGMRLVGLPWYLLSAFYYFNLVLIGFALALHKQYGTRFLYTTVYACIFSGILQITLSNIFATSGEGVRGALFFTNPNQLGYYSLSALTIVLVLESMIKIPKFIVYASFFIFSYMSLVSVSKAAMGSMVILFATYLIANKVFSVKNILAIVIVGGIGFFAIMKTQFGQTFLKNYELREQNEETRPDTITEWEYRGYDRISNHPQYLIFGAGEGGYNRFDTFITNHEIHSSIGTIVFCYGIPGSILFALFVYALLRKLPWNYLLYSIPIFAYGATHMGLRFSIFWVALMMFPVIRIEIQKKKYLIYKKRLENSKSNNRTSLPPIPVEGAA